MANTIKHKRGSGSNPSASDLVAGELAIRTDTGVVFTKKDDGTVAEIAGGGAEAINDLSDAVTNSSGRTIGLGTDALANDDGTTNLNTALGYQALTANTSGAVNTASAIEQDKQVLLQPAILLLARLQVITTPQVLPILTLAGKPVREPLPEVTTLVVGKVLGRLADLAAQLSLEPMQEAIVPVRIALLSEWELAKMLMEPKTFSLAGTLLKVHFQRQPH